MAFSLAGTIYKIVAYRPKKRGVDDIEAHYIRHCGIAEEPCVHREAYEDGVGESAHGDKPAPSTPVHLYAFAEQYSRAQRYQHTAKWQQKQKKRFIEC